MPRRPLAPCAEPGCGALVERGRCPQHQRAEYRREQVSRGTATQRGYGVRHRRWRLMVLNAHPVCCDPSGCNEPSVVADHVMPLSEGGDWSLSNSQGLCVRHHNAKTAREMNARRKA